MEKGTAIERYLAALNEEDGYGLLESVLLLSLASIAGVAALTTMGNTIQATRYQQAAGLFGSEPRLTHRSRGGGNQTR